MCHCVVAQSLVKIRSRGLNAVGRAFDDFWGENIFVRSI